MPAGVHAQAAGAMPRQRHCFDVLLKSLDAVTELLASHLEGAHVFAQGLDVLATGLAHGWRVIGKVRCLLELQLRGRVCDRVRATGAEWPAPCRWFAAVSACVECVEEPELSQGACLTAGFESERW